MKVSQDLLKEHILSLMCQKVTEVVRRKDLDFHSSLESKYGFEVPEGTKIFNYEEVNGIPESDEPPSDFILVAA